MGNNSEIIAKLIQLQPEISKEYQIEDKIEEIPSELNEKKNLLFKAQESLSECSRNEAELKKQIEKYTQNKIDAESKREALEKSVETIDLPRDYENVSKEIEIAQKEEQRARNMLLETQKQLDELLLVITQKQAEVEAYQVSVSEESAKLEQTIEELQKELADVRENITALSQGVDESTMFRFRRIIRHKTEDGIVAIKMTEYGPVCEGCHLTLPLQFLNDVRKNEIIHYCPYCGSVIFFDENDKEQAELLNRDVELNDEEEDSSGNIDVSGFATSEDEFLD